MAKGHYTGTIATSNMSHHAGKFAGAGELGAKQMASPGKASMKTKTKMSGLPFEGSPNGGKSIGKNMPKTNKGGC
jgi:hypothetical protein